MLHDSIKVTVKGRPTTDDLPAQPKHHLTQIEQPFSAATNLPAYFGIVHKCMAASVVP